MSKSEVLYYHQPYRIRVECPTECEIRLNEKKWKFLFYVCSVTSHSQDLTHPTPNRWFLQPSFTLLTWTPMSWWRWQGLWQVRECHLPWPPSISRPSQSHRASPSTLCSWRRTKNKVRCFACVYCSVEDGINCHLRLSSFISLLVFFSFSWYLTYFFCMWGDTPHQKKKNDIVLHDLSLLHFPREHYAHCHVAMWWDHLVM